MNTLDEIKNLEDTLRVVQIELDKLKEKFSNLYAYKPLWSKTMYSLERTTGSFERYGIKKAYGYHLINEGLFPPPINKNEKPSRVPTHEVDTVIKAKIAGANENQIKELVSSMLEKRKLLLKGLFNNKEVS